MSGRRRRRRPERDGDTDPVPRSLAGSDRMTVRVGCPDDRHLDATASAVRTGIASYYPKPATAGGPARTARIAVSATNGRAEKLGCAHQWSDSGSAPPPRPAYPTPRTRGAHRA